MTLGLTGATGRLGGRIARQLTDVQPVLLVREPARVTDPAARVRQASYDNPGTSLAGISTLFMVSAAEHPDRVGQHRRFVDAAAAAGVQHVVYTSFYGAAPDATFTLDRRCRRRGGRRPP